MQSQKCQVEGHNHFPRPAGYPLTNRAHYMVGLLSYKDTAELCSILVDQDLLVFLCNAAFQPVSPWPVLLHRVILSLVRDLALASLEFHGPVSPFLQPVQVPLNSSHTLQHGSCSPWFGIICNLARSELYLIALVANNHDK